MTSLQSNYIIVSSPNISTNKINSQVKNKKKKKEKVSTNIIHDLFHRAYSMIVTIRTHDLWDDIQVINRTDYVCISYISKFQK